MAYSKITIIFSYVPDVDDFITITESKLGLSLHEVFKTNRTNSWQVKIPSYSPDDGIHPERWIGYISDYYKTAFFEDYNQSNLFTVTSIRGAVNSGEGTIIIEANYPGAIFDVELTTLIYRTIIENDNVIPDPDPDPEPKPNAVSPLELVFDVLTDIPTSDEKYITITANESWEVTSNIPAWLTLSQTSGTGNIIIAATPVNYAHLNDGQYTSPIIIKIGAQEFVITVKLNVTSVISNPYLSGKPAFTLDQKNFIISGTNTETYFQFDSTIVTHKFFTDQTKTFTFPQKALLFNGKSEINIGQLIHRLMDKFDTINSNVHQYKYAILSVTVNELMQSDNSVIKTITIPDIKFVAGLSQGFSEFGFLEFNKKTTRITNQGFYYLNILIPNGNFELRTFKNGKLVSTLLLPEISTGPLSQKVSFNNYDKGDFIEFIIDRTGQNTENPPKKSFYVFPNQTFSNTIVWENEYLLQSALEFTHDHDIKTEIERQSTKTYHKFVERTNHKVITKENKLTINTGWVSKNDIDSIESLIMSKRAFLNLNGKIIDMVPIGKSLTNYDSKDELFDYTFEFIINRVYNEETYTF